ncbi:MAG: MBL fold metallo-hydrolase [Bacilli bacterium]|nr:MBL fold metallo-hydrolase [Bacilli bacterium]
MKIHFLNTIWSDAIILENNHHFAFIDTGSAFYYPMVDRYLKDLKVEKLDFILITHFHNDHYGNTKQIIDNYQIDKLYLKHYYGLDGTTSSGSTSNDEYTNSEMSKYLAILDAANNHNTDTIFLDDFNLDYLTINLDNLELEIYEIRHHLSEMYNDPKGEFYHQKKFNQNFNSACVFFKINNFNVFLGADLTCSKTDIVELKGIAIKTIEKIYQKHDINHIDIYKSCHHGGSGTNPKELCDLLKAKHVIITNTARWLDTYTTCDDLRLANKEVNILTTDHQKYVFDISDKITYQTIKEESLFLTLKKD